MTEEASLFLAWEVLSTCALALMLYSLGMLILVLLARRRARPEDIREVVLTPIVRLSPYALICLLVPLSLAYILRNRLILTCTITLFALVMFPSIIIALLISSLPLLIALVARYGRAMWPALLGFSIPYAPALYLMSHKVLSLIPLMPGEYATVFAILSAVFTIGGMVSVPYPS